MEHQMRRLSALLQAILSSLDAYFAHPQRPEELPDPLDSYRARAAIRGLPDPTTSPADQKGST